MSYRDFPRNSRYNDDTTWFRADHADYLALRRSLPRTQGLGVGVQRHPLSKICPFRADNTTLDCCGQRREQSATPRNTEARCRRLCRRRAARARTQSLDRWQEAWRSITFNAAKCAVLRRQPFVTAPVLVVQPLLMRGGDPHRDRKSMSARMPGAGQCHDRRRPAVRRYSAGARSRHPVDSRCPTKTAHPRASSPEDPP
jgi:hypothetical protein